MAEKITFGVNAPTVDPNNVQSGALGSTANSTTTGTKQAPKKTGLEQFTANAQADLERPIKQPTPNNVVTTEQLESAASSPSLKLPEPTEPERIDVSSALDKITAGATEVQKTLDKNKERLDLEATQKTQTDELGKAFDSLSNIGAFESELGDDVELQKKKELKTEIDNKIMRKSRDFDLAIREAEDTFGTRAQKNAKKAEIVKDYNRQLADLSIIQMARAGEYNDARAYVDEKVRLELQDRQNDLNKLMFFYNENKERLTTLDQRAFQEKIVQEERAYQEEYATRKRLEDIKATMTINASEDGAGNAQLMAIQNAGSLTELMSLENAGRWSKSKADRLAEQLASVNLARASTELNILRNPPAPGGGVSDEAIKAMRSLNVTQQTNLADANDTVRSLNRLKEMVSQYSSVELENPATPVGQEFKRISSDVVDKMARDRTGAVVTSSEEKAFKRILGLGFFNRSISGKDAVTETLDRQLMKHNETVNLIDPTGEIRQALGSISGNTSETADSYLDRVDAAIGQGVYGAYE